MLAVIAGRDPEAAQRAMEANLIAAVRAYALAPREGGRHGGGGIPSRRRMANRQARRARWVVRKRRESTARGGFSAPSVAQTSHGRHGNGVFGAGLAVGSRSHCRTLGGEEGRRGMGQVLRDLALSLALASSSTPALTRRSMPQSRQPLTKVHQYLVTCATWRGAPISRSSSAPHTFRIATWVPITAAEQCWRSR
jgi:hypothetical protein